MIKIEKANNITIATICETDRIYVLNAEQLKKELRQLADEQGVKLILNLENINFIDSLGFSLFLSILKLVNFNSGKFMMCNMSANIQELFRLLHLHNIFVIDLSLNDCLKAIK